MKGFLALGLSWLLSFGGAAAAAGFRDVGAKEGAAVVEANRSTGKLVILDIRTPAEFAEERLAGAVLLDYYAPTFRQELAKLDRDKTYFVYCRTGNRSGKTLGILRELGFQDVVHLATGITGWKQAGLPTVR